MLTELLVAGLIYTSNPILEKTTPEIVTEQVIEEEPKPKELTIQEKIDSNFYKCDEAIQYIRADNAECLDKPIAVAPVQQTTTTTKARTTTVRGSNVPSGWYPYGQCTWYVWTKRSVGNWNNASSWLWQARRDGYATGSTPQVGAIAWQPGHVAYVSSVHSNGTVTVSEYNYSVSRGYSSRTVPASTFTYIY